MTDSEIEIGSCTDIGNVREVNEDRILAETVPAGPKAAPLALLLVADGLGGHEGGEVASAMARDTLREVVDQAFSAGAPPASHLSKILANALKLANERIYEVGREMFGAGRPGTTMTACLLSAKRYDIAHVGDSRAYMVSPRHIMQLTDDDSVVADAVRQGLITQEQARLSPYRNQLTRSIGTTVFVDPSIYHAPSERGDVIVLCSDGLSEYVAPDEIRDAVIERPVLQQVCRDLVELAKQRGGHDNISVVAARAGRWNPRQNEAARTRQTARKPQKPRTLPLFRRSKPG